MFRVRLTETALPQPDVNFNDILIVRNFLPANGKEGDHVDENATQ